MLAEVGLRLAEGLFSLLARTSLAENMAACLLLVSTLVELLDQQAAPLLQPIASTAERVGLHVWHTHAAHACMWRGPAPRDVGPSIAGPRHWSMPGKGVRGGAAWLRPPGQSRGVLVPSSVRLLAGVAWLACLPPCSTWLLMSVLGG